MTSLMNISQTLQDSRMQLIGFRRNSTITLDAYEVMTLQLKLLNLKKFLLLKFVCTMYINQRGI